MRSVLSLALLVPCLLTACKQPYRDFVAEVTSEDKHTRGFALLSMSDEEEERYFPLVLYIADNDPEPMVRGCAIRALGISDNPLALPVLEHHLRTRYRLEAVQGLRGYRPLPCDLLVREWLAGPDPDPRIEKEIARALASDRDGECPRLLLEHRDSHPERVEPVLAEYPFYMRDGW